MRKERAAEKVSDRSSSSELKSPRMKMRNCDAREKGSQELKSESTMVEERSGDRS